MNMQKYSKALVPLVGALLTLGANAVGIAPELITPDVTTLVVSILVAISGGVYQISNKS